MVRYFSSGHGSHTSEQTWKLSIEFLRDFLAFWVRRKHVDTRADGSGIMSNDGYSSGIASKGGYMLLYPIQGGPLILDTIITSYVVAETHKPLNFIILLVPS